MASLTHQDVALLQNSLQNVGQSFRTTRLDAELIKDRQLENKLRQTALNNQEKRLDNEAEGETTAYLQGNDGVVVGFRGSPNALQAYSSKAGLRPVNKPETGQHPYRISFTTPDADVTVFARPAP